MVTLVALGSGNRARRPFRGGIELSDDDVILFVFIVSSFEIIFEISKVVFVVFFDIESFVVESVVVIGSMWSLPVDTDEVVIAIGCCMILSSCCCCCCIFCCSTDIKYCNRFLCSDYLLSV